MGTRTWNNADVVTLNAALSTGNIEHYYIRREMHVRPAAQQTHKLRSSHRGTEAATCGEVKVHRSLTRL